KKFPHDIDVVVDRIVVRPDIGQRLAESFETALKLAEGLAVIEYADAPAGATGPLATSPLAGEVDAKRREGGTPRTPASAATPLPNPAPQGGREQTEPAAKKVA